MNIKKIEEIIQKELLFDPIKQPELRLNQYDEWKAACEALNLTYDYLPKPRIELYQHRTMFRFNTDTVLLAGFMRIHKHDTVLDIGTNNGVLVLAAAQYSDQKIIGVELQGEACLLAKKNIRLHKLEDQCSILHQNIQDVDITPVDVIISNPPYFPLSEQSIQTTPKQMARHEITLNLKTLIDQINRLLKDGGHCYLVHRADRLSEIIERFHAIHMEVKQVQPVYDEQKEDARCVLIEAVKQAKCGCRLLSPIIIKR